MQDIGLAVREALYVLGQHENISLKIKEKFSSTIPLKYARALKAYAKARNARYSTVIEEMVIMCMQILPNLPQIAEKTNDVNKFIHDAILEKLNDN